MKNYFIWWNLHKLRNFETSNLAKSEYLPLCTIVYCGLDCKVSIAQSIFCLTAERTSLYNAWSLKMPGFFLVDFISTHSGQFFTLCTYLSTYQSYMTLVHEYWNQFENWIFYLLYSIYCIKFRHYSKNLAVQKKTFVFRSKIIFPEKNLSVFSSVELKDAVNKSY